MGQPAKGFRSFGWNVYSQSSGNALGVFRNEASLANIHNFTAGIMAERRFMLNATSSYAFAVVLPASSGAFSLQGIGTGYENFVQQQVALAYGRPLASWFNVGLQLDYLNMRIPQYGSAHAFTFGISTLFRWKKYWSLGLQAFNPVGVTYTGLGDDEILSLYRVGVGYQPSPNFFLSTELSKSEGFPAEIATAFHYRIMKQLGIKGGISTGEQKIFLGIAILLSRFAMMFSAINHQRLGLTPGAGFIYNSKKQ